MYGARGQADLGRAGAIGVRDPCLRAFGIDYAYAACTGQRAHIGRILAARQQATQRAVRAGRIQAHNGDGVHVRQGDKERPLVGGQR